MSHRQTQFFMRSSPASLPPNPLYSMHRPILRQVQLCHRLCPSSRPCPSNVSMCEFDATQMVDQPPTARHTRCDDVLMYSCASTSPQIHRDHSRPTWHPSIASEPVASPDINSSRPTGLPVALLFHHPTQFFTSAVPVLPYIDQIPRVYSPTVNFFWPIPLMPRTP